MTSLTSALPLILFLLQAGYCHLEGMRIIFPDEIIKPGSISRSGFLTRNSSDDENIKAPNISRSDYYCGYRFPCAIYYGSLYNDGREVHIYHINRTAENLISEGFQIDILDMHGDAISNMTFSNGSYTGNIAFQHFMAVAAAGGEPAEVERAQYMAQLGVRKGDKIQFLCGGVLINRHWVLTAAHCFVGMGYDLNFLRLGDYDITMPEASNDVVHGKRVEDYVIQDVIFHPEYKPAERYHDLALVPLSRRTPDYSPSINPICLPWDNINEDFEGREVVLTGWGATKYGGRKTPLLQQVKLKVYNASICHKSYSTLPRFSKRHPQGLSSDNILCVGWDENGKDACNGDSGAPIVIGKDKNNNYGNFILAGIVSGGYECGHKEYPGLYIPVNKPKYLRWIKKVAFKYYD